MFLDEYVRVSVENLRLCVQIIEAKEETLWAKRQLLAKTEECNKMQEEVIANLKKANKFLDEYKLLARGYSRLHRKLYSFGVKCHGCGKEHMDQEFLPTASSDKMVYVKICDKCGQEMKLAYKPVETNHG